MSRNDRARPTANEAGHKLSNDHNDDESIVARCARCQRAIWARESVTAGIGRQCRRVLARSMREAAA